MKPVKHVSTATTLINFVKIAVKVTGALLLAGAATLMYGVIIFYFSMLHNYAVGSFLQRFYIDALAYLAPIVFLTAFMVFIKTFLSLSRKNRKHQKPTRIPTILQEYTPTIVRHLPFLAIVAAVCLFIVGVSYLKYIRLFSPKDFANLASNVEATLKAIGTTDIATNKHCHATAPGKFEPDRLYCALDLAARVPSDHDALDVAMDLGAAAVNIGQLGTFTWYDDPPGGKIAHSAIELKGFKKAMCRISIYTGKSAQYEVVFLPKGHDDASTVVAFFCRAESQQYIW